MEAQVRGWSADPLELIAEGGRRLEGEDRLVPAVPAVDELIRGLEADAMLEHADLVAFVATTDIERARAFYCDTLGLVVVVDTPFALVLDAHGTTVRVTPVEECVVAPYTALGWEVADMDDTVRSLAAAGVRFERFAGMEQDDAGVWSAPGGDRVAWFRDPDGHLLSITGAAVATRR